MLIKEDSILPNSTRSPQTTPNPWSWNFPKYELHNLQHPQSIFPVVQAVGRSPPQYTHPWCEVHWSWWVYQYSPSPAWQVSRRWLWSLETWTLVLAAVFVLRSMCRRGCQVWEFVSDSTSVEAMQVSQTRDVQCVRGKWEHTIVLRIRCLLCSTLWQYHRQNQRCLRDVWSKHDHRFQARNLVHQHALWCRR